MVYLATDGVRTITSCNHNYSREGTLHPDRIIQVYDLLYMQQGIWEIREENACYRLEPQQALLLEPGKHHFSRTKCSPEMRNVYIHFTVCAGDGECSPQNLCLNKLTNCREMPDVYRCFERIIETYWSDSLPNKNFRLRALLDILLLQLSDISRQQQREYDVLVSQIIRHFQSSPDRFFSPEELAEQYGVSLRTISGRFKRETGQSIHQYQLQMKLKMAYDILPHNPGRGLRDIAISFGFYDEFQFSKLFKRQFGISPSERRRT